MNLLQSILATVTQQRDSGKSSFTVSSIWVTDKVIVLDTLAPAARAAKQAEALTRELHARFPDATVTTGVDDGSTVISIAY